jgi:[acyl-carrier-protein] S-malonyltransferase
MFDVVAGVPEAEAVIAAVDRLLPAPSHQLLDSGADIFRNRVAQPLICAAILARWQALRHALPDPALVLGYSVGEVAAHAIAGSYSVDDCLRLAGRRARLMDDASPAAGGLIAILGLREESIRKLCSANDAEVAIANSASHFVVGGPLPALDAIGREAAARGARIVRLNVEAPAHTSWLRPAADGFRLELGATALRRPDIPILAGIDGHVVRDPADVAASLAAQIAQTVDWRTCVAHAWEMGIRVFFELGPGDALSRMVRETYPSADARSLDDFRTLAGAIDGIRKAIDRS